jgi:hypothetical protein
MLLGLFLDFPWYKFSCQDDKMKFTPLRRPPAGNDKTGYPCSDCAFAPMDPSHVVVYADEDGDVRQTCVDCLGMIEAAMDKVVKNSGFKDM